MESEKPQSSKVELTTNSVVTVALAAALAVSICSGDADDAKKEIEELQKTVERLETKVDALVAANAQRSAPPPATETVQRR